MSRRAARNILPRQNAPRFGMTLSGLRIERPGLVAARLPLRASADPTALAFLRSCFAAGPPPAPPDGDSHPLFLRGDWRLLLRPDLKKASPKAGELRSGVYRDGAGDPVLVLIKGFADGGSNLSLFLDWVGRYVDYQRASAGCGRIWWARGGRGRDWLIVKAPLGDQLILKERY